MSISYETVKDFWDYVEFYPYEDEEGYDGVHDGGIKGLREGAPAKAVKAYEKYRKIEQECDKQHIVL